MRKGISSIVAVVLLIAITVVAAIGIYFWAAGLATKPPTPEKPVPIVANPISSRSVLIANLGNKPIHAEVLKTSDPSTVCDFGKNVTIEPGSQVRCELKGFPKSQEIVIYGEGTGSAPVHLLDTRDILQDSAKKLGYNGGTANDIDTDGKGHFYIAASYLVDGVRHSLAIATNESGDVLWDKDLGTGRFYDLVYSSGYVYLTGYSGTWGNSNISVSKLYTGSGTVIWSKSFDVGKADRAYVIVSDDNGNVYPVGEANATTDKSLVVLKVSPNGDLLWEAKYDGGTYDNASGYADVYYDGYVYAVGAVRNSTSVNTVLVKINASNGNIIWAKVYDVGENSTLYGIVAYKGYLYASGQEWTQPDASDSVYLVMKFDTDGNLITKNRWLTGNERYGGGGGTIYDGYFYTFGAAGEDQTKRIAVIKWDTNLNVIYSQTLNFTEPTYAYAGVGYNGYLYQAGGTTYVSPTDIVWVKWELS